MRFARTLAILAMALIPLGTALAHTYDDVVGQIAAKATPADMVTAINASKDTWLPRHVYGLLDKGAPKEVVQAAAVKAAVFYDPNMKSLDQIGAEERAKQPAATVKVVAPADWTSMFSAYEKAKGEIDAAKASVQVPTAANAGETEAAFDKRVRQAEEERVRKMAVPEGKLTQTVWALDIPAALDAYDSATRCFPKAAVVVDLQGMSFAQMRATMNGTKPEYPVAFDPKDGKTITSVKFVTTEGQKKFEAISKPICVYPDEAGGVKSAGVNFRVSLQRGAKEGEWTAKGNFVNARTGEPVLVKK
jgi:hypothetical protein